MTYSTQDIEFLQANWTKMNSYELAIKLKRQQGSISRKLTQLGLITEKAKKIQESKKLRRDGKQRCLLCQDIFPWDTTHFHKQGNTLSSVCKSCASSRATHDYYARHDTVERAIHHKLLKAKRANRHRFTEYLNEKEALEQFQKQNGHCFYTQELLTHQAGLPNSLTMDRKDVTQGYTKDNVVFCCNIINYMKQSLSPQDFVMWCQKVSAHQFLIV